MSERLWTPGAVASCAIWLLGGLWWPCEAAPAPVTAIPIDQQNGETEIGADWISDAETGEAAGEFETMADILARLRRNPADTNRVTRVELERLPGISASDIDGLLAYRARRGGIASLSEVDSIQAISPFARYLFREVLLVAAPTGRPAPPVRWLEVRISAGRSESSYASAPDSAGSPWRRTMRISAQEGAVSGALTFQNEAYERWLWDPGAGIYGFDHVAGYLAWSAREIPVEVLIGDIKVEAGQGLLHAGPFGTRLTPDAPWRILRSGSGPSGYAGSTRARTYRGIGVISRLPAGLGLSLFASRRRVDARALDSEGSPEGYALVRTDLHVSEAQRSRRGNLLESGYGMLLEWTDDATRIGIQYAESRFARPVALIQNTATRSRYGHGGIHWMIRRGVWAFSGEMVRGTGYEAVVVGVHIRPVRSAHLFGSWRRFPTSGATPYGQAYGYRRHGAEERILTLGFGLRLAPGSDARFSIEVANRSGTAETHQLPERSLDVRASVSVAPSDGIALNAILRSKETEKAGEMRNAAGTTLAVAVEEHFLLGSLSVRLTDARFGAFVTRIGANATGRDGQPGSPGFYLSQSAVLRISDRLELAFQETVFAAPAFENRFYVYEPDVHGRLSVPSLQHAGDRTSARVRIRLPNRILLEGKWAAARTEIDAEKNETGKPETRRSRTIGVQLSISL